MLLGELNLATIIARLIVLLVAFTIHELAHAITADYLGDPTPRRMGRITLNPIAHLDPFGSLMLLISGFGWAKPVMVQPLNLRGNPRTSMAIVAAAGPLSNLLLAILFAVPVRMGLIGLSFGNPRGLFPSLEGLVFEFIWINLILLFFNLIPVPPLDGYRILTGILPPELAIQLRVLEQYGFLILLLLIFLLPVVGIDVLGFLVATPSAELLFFLIG
ncbi:MAG: site-2 protease family protein [Chloroflexi bacterium]|nr:MAG: site-2 protease family protein [Chloroflexota bacterium]